MKSLLLKLKRNYFVFTPFLLALYSVIFLFARNQKEYTLPVVIVPAIIALVLAGIVLLVFKFIFKNLQLASILSSIIVFICLSYGRFLDWGKDDHFNIGSFQVGNSPIIGFIVVTFLIIAFFLIFKFKKHLQTANKFIFVLAVILLILPLFDAISFEVKSGRLLRQPAQAREINTKEEKSTDTPDIYYFIFDRYAGPKSLKEQYGFDNSQFYNYLKDKGFYLAEGATTNYPKTFLSLGSSLNMEYMDFLTQQTHGGASGDESIVTPFIQDSKVLNYLKDKGYKYVQVGSWWQPTRENPYADISFFPPKKGYPYADEFTTGFLNTTIAGSLFKVVFHDPMDVSIDPQNNIHRASALYDFKVFEDIPKIKGPKFVFAHILLPHDPFVFDKDCRPIPETVVNKNSHQVNYKNQILCANKKIESMVNGIISKSKKTPIIILQSDEGPFPMNVPIPEKQSWGTAETTSLREKFPILNAYLLPGKDTEGLYQTITPVNSFRIILNKYFGENFPLLEDRNYVFQDEDHYYQFKDVTDKVQN